MRRSLARHLRQLKPPISTIVATHAHEEHVGNLNWLSDKTGARSVYLRNDRPVPDALQEVAVRACRRDRPTAEPEASFSNPAKDSRDEFKRAFILQVIASPGHCDDHVVLYDPAEKILLAGDAFMVRILRPRIQMWIVENG